MKSFSSRGRGRGGVRSSPYYSRESLNQSHDNISSSREYVSGSREHVYSSRERVYGSREFVSSSRDRGYTSKEQVSGSSERISGSRENFYRSNASNTLPRQRPRTIAGSGDLLYGGSLPRPNRNNRNRSGGEYQAGEGGRGRGRGRSSLAPSQRRISKQREVRRDSRERRRAQSVPKQEVMAGESITRSMMTIWTPDGRCPSFADMLKKNSVSEIAQDQGIENSFFFE